MSEPRDRIRTAIEGSDGPALVAFVTAGYPSRDRFLDDLAAVARSADVVEIGVPFSDPMADGVTIQRSSRVAIENGVSLRWILYELRKRTGQLSAPIVLMSYLNPLLVYGFDRLAEDALEAGVDGFIVPDLPMEESASLLGALSRRALALIQLVTPATPEQRLAELAQAGSGFVYAVTRTGTTGSGGMAPGLSGYLEAVRRVSDLPVCAGFGVRTQSHVVEIGRHADGVIVGSALIEVLERGDDPAAFLTSLRG